MPALHLFVDTNVWLSFFAFAKDDIAELRKLIDLIKNGTLKLYVPNQVAHEFLRNREVKVAATIKDFQESFSKSVPRFLMDFEEAKVFEKAVADLAKARNDLVQKAKDGAIARSFAVDTLVKDVFDAAEIGDVTPQMIESARLRKERGNPPGKGQLLGDQINWEYLLSTVPDDVTLHVVSHDGDYQSAMKDGHPHHYLKDEWRDVKNGNLCLHKELKPFLNEQFDIIKLEVDKEKEKAINGLIESSNFATTHEAISIIMPFFDALTVDDAKRLLEAGVSNQQIYWISRDADVKYFYQNLLDNWSGVLGGDLESQGEKLFRGADA